MGNKNFVHSVVRYRIRTCQGHVPTKATVEQTTKRYATTFFFSHLRFWLYGMPFGEAGGTFLQKAPYNIRPKGAAFLFALFFISAVAQGQKLKQSDYDGAKKQWRIETFPVNLKTASGVKMDVALGSTEAAPLVLQLTGSGLGASTVIAGDKAILLLDDDSTVTVRSATVQDVARGSNTYSHEYVLKPADLEVLSRHNLQGVRKYSTEGYDDVYIEAENAGKLKELSSLFLKELRNKTVLFAQPSSAQAGFPGGNGVLLKFLNRNLKAPSSLDSNERRYSRMQFTVKPDGSVSDVSVAYSAGDAFDKELLRMWQRMPKWKPALQDGEKVEATVTQPMTFVQTGTVVQIRF